MTCAMTILCGDSTSVEFAGNTNRCLPVNNILKVWIIIFSLSYVLDLSISCFDLKLVGLP